NLGTMPALIAASALLIDYVLTVSVSIAAGVAAITSALPHYHLNPVALSLMFVVILMFGNLRGIRESGRLFAAPTYFFIAGITMLAHAYGIIPTDSETVVSQIARATFGGRGWPYYALQAGTMLILVLAANTAYADFPRLASIVARDRFLPRQFMNRGDRLAF